MPAMSSSYNALVSAIMLEENSSYTNNPGALMDANGQPLQFPNLQAGIDALNQKIGFDVSGASKVYSPNESLYQYENTYTGGDPNAANNVASMLGVSPSTPVGQLSDQNVSPPNSFWQRVKNMFANAYGNPNLTSGIGGSAQVGLGGGTLTDNTTTNASKTSHIAVDAVCVLLGLILVAISVFGLSKVQDASISVAKVAAKAAA